MVETREQLLQEAYGLRNLGRYPEAHSCFGNARELGDDLMLAVDIASTYLEQGNVKECLEQINIAIQKFGSSTSDQVVVALAKILQASASVATTLRFRESLTAGSDLFKEYLSELPVEKYDGRLVALLLAYYYMRGLADLCGFDVTTAPVPSTEFIKSLYRYLAASKQYSNAFQIAKLYSAAAGPQHRTELLDEFLELDDAPELVRAEALLEVTNLLYAADHQVDALSKLESAMDLYQNQKHATGPLLLEVQRFTMLPLGDKDQRQVRKRTLFRLKCELESFQCYDGMRQALNALYQLAQAEQDDTLRVELDSEMQRLSSIRGCPMDWISQQLILLSNWKRAGPSTGQMLLSLEALYQDMEIMEAPAVQAGVAHTLAEKYREVGDTVKAEKWRRTANAELGIGPRYAGFLVGSDVFYRVLEESTTAPDNEEAEIQDLREELLRVIEDVRPDSTPPNFIYFGIMKVTHICELYLDKFVLYQLRGFDRTKRLVETCLEVSDALIQILPSSQKKKWDATVLTVRARMLSLQAVPGIINSEALYRAIETYEEAASLFSESGLELNNAQVQQQIAGCYKQLWILDECSTTSEYFAAVVTMYESAGKVMKTHGTIEQQRLNLFTLLSHWYMGHERGVTYRKGSYQETIDCLREAEKIIDRERQELSALSHHEAIAAKQNMRRNKSMSLIFETAIKLFASSGDTKSLWDWVQKSKARSISDQLGLGIILPRDLKERIEIDPVASELLSKEETLAKVVKTADPAAQFLARKALETHQRTMGTIDTLREVLELREGKPITWKALQQLHDPHSAQSERSIWFVDWFTVENQIFLIAVPNKTEAYSVYKVDINLESVDQWIRKNIDCREPLNDGEGLASLKELSKLVDPLVNQIPTKEGDLLVFCMTGILHRVPVHAAVISGDPDDSDSCKTLIERNPIIYTSSITITQQCTTRAATRTMDHVTIEGEQQQATVLSVYERGDEENSPGWEIEREKVYQICRDLTKQMQWGDAFCGIDAGRSRFKAACESAIVHFSGHFNYDEDILDHGIELALPGVSGEDPSGPTDVHAPPHNSVISEDIFSVKDTFSSKVKTSHFSLIACASAKQKVQKGDEPLGMVTALLYAGATSVAGTLWPIASGTGRAFTGLFYEKFRTASSEGSGRTIDLAIALQETVKAMRGKEALEEPYNWAGFVLHGTWLFSRKV